MKKKLLTLFLSAMSVFFVFGAKVSAETISVVSDTAYAPFEFKDSDQTYKGIDVDIINEVAKRKNWDVNQTFPGFDAAVNAVQSGLIEMMIYSENMQGKYILIVPLSDVSDMTLFATAQDYFEGSIYKVSGDTVNLTEMVTRIAEGGFAQLLGLSV